MGQVNGKAKISIPHSSHIFQPILMKLKTKKNIWDTTHMQNLVNVERRERGLHREGIFRYFWCSIPFCILAHAYRSHQKTDLA